MSMTTLKWPDYIIIVAFFVISLGIGVYHSLTGGRQRTTQEFIMANRHLSIIPTTISLLVSYVSAILVLGSTAEMYLYGIHMLVWSPVAFAIAVVVAVLFIVPWIYPLKLVSVNDYLERRFQSKAVRVLGAMIGILVALMYMGVAMYAPSAALESATGLSVGISIPLMAVISVTYTALGGMRAVIWTDVFQCGAMLGGMLAIMIKGMIVVGGFPLVLDQCAQGGRLLTANWSPDPTVRHTVWGFLIGGSFSWVIIYGLSQASVQRYSATESLLKARITLLVNIPANWLITFITSATGLTVYAYYAKVRCDPLVNRDIHNPNQLLSLFVTTIFADSHGFAGLFLSTLYGGALSSISSSLSGASANCWDDILRLKLSGMAESRKALVNRLLVVIFGIIATGIAFLASIVPGPITQVISTIASIAIGPMAGVFLLGGVSRHGNWKGALVGGFGGLVMATWLNVGAFAMHGNYPPLPFASTTGCTVDNFTSGSTNLTDELWEMTSAAYDNATSFFDNRPAPTTRRGLDRFYSLSYIWYTMFGALMTLVIGFLTSLVFRDKKAEAEVDEMLLIPFRQCLFCTRERTTVEENGGPKTAKLNNNNNDIKVISCAEDDDIALLNGQQREPAGDDKDIVMATSVDEFLRLNRRSTVL